MIHFYDGLDPDGGGFGYIEDNENMWQPCGDDCSGNTQLLYIKVEPDLESLNWPAGYSVTITYDGGKTKKICFTQVIDGDFITRYVAEDGTTCSDERFCEDCYTCPTITPTPTVTPTTTPTETPTPTITPTITPTQTPCHAPLMISHINDVTINNLRSGEADGWEFDFYNIGTTMFGYIFDNENEFNDLNTLDNEAVKVVVNNGSDPSIAIQSGDSVTIRYNGGTPQPVYFPAVTIGGSTFYVGADGSTYTDANLCTPCDTTPPPTITPTPTETPTETPTPTPTNTP